ncbi:MAG: Ribosome recycling factor [Firmicutes bacterium]|nr:Ribosome recycling factor [Bacillota bacterium]MDI6704705.1 ribosome recycling factor [Bacillota bacterium]
MFLEIHKETEEKMKKTVKVLEEELATIRAGRANPALLDKVMVEYYGVPTPLNQIAGLSAPEARLLIIQPYDSTALGNIEKAILKSDLGLNPSNDGRIIRLVIPQLTEERRRELVKLVKKYGEEAKVAIRNERRNANDELKRMKKDGDITEDDEKKAQDEVQKLTDRYVENIDQVVAKKEQEIMEV